MMKLIGVAVSKFANAIAGSTNTGNNNVSVVFSPRQAPRFEGLNGEPVTLPNPPQNMDNEDDEDEDKPQPATKKRAGEEAGGVDHH